MGEIRVNELPYKGELTKNDIIHVIGEDGKDYHSDLGSAEAAFGKSQIIEGGDDINLHNQDVNFLLIKPNDNIILDVTDRIVPLQIKHIGTSHTIKIINSGGTIHNLVSDESLRLVKANDDNHYVFGLSSNIRDTSN